MWGHRKEDWNEGSDRSSQTCPTCVSKNHCTSFIPAVEALALFRFEEVVALFVADFKNRLSFIFINFSYAKHRTARNTGSLSFTVPSVTGRYSYLYNTACKSTRGTSCER